MEVKDLNPRGVKYSMHPVDGWELDGKNGANFSHQTVDTVEHGELLGFKQQNMLNYSWDTWLWWFSWVKFKVLG